MSSDEEGEGKETALSTAASLLKVSRLSFCRYQCCGSGMFVLDPDFFHTGSINNKEKDAGKLLVSYLFFIAIFTKLENNLI
jgi:hypothetical protein